MQKLVLSSSMPPFSRHARDSYSFCPLRSGVRRKGRRSTQGWININSCSSYSHHRHKGNQNTATWESHGRSPALSQGRLAEREPDTRSIHNPYKMLLMYKRLHVFSVFDQAHAIPTEDFGFIKALPAMGEGIGPIGESVKCLPMRAGKNTSLSFLDVKASLLSRAAPTIPQSPLC